MTSPWREGLSRVLLRVALNRMACVPRRDEDTDSHRGPAPGEETSMRPGEEASEDASPAVSGFWSRRLQTARTARSQTSAVQTVQPAG